MKKLPAALILIIMSVPGVSILDTAHNQIPAQVFFPSISSVTSSNGSISLELYNPTGSPYSYIALYRALEPLGIKVSNYGYLIQITGPSSSVSRQAESIVHLENAYHLSPGPGNVTYTPFLSYQPDQSGQPYSPSLLAQAYSMEGAYRAGINGSNETIAIIDAFGDPSIQFDVKAFDYMYSIPGPLKLNVVYLNTTPNAYNPSWATETALDVEWAHAMAPGATIDLVVSPNANSGLNNAISYVIYHHLASVVSLSWGTPEYKIADTNLTQMDSIFQQAAFENISVFAASGDEGAYNGTTLTVSYPASDPYVTGVGGTTLSLLNGVFSESAWGGRNAKGSYGSGGGFSGFFTQPSWQKTAFSNNSMRGVPDVSMDANPATGVEAISEGGQIYLGGTSLATPMWAAVAAMMDQRSHRDIGFLNPLLYYIGSSSYYSSAFNDITTGNNGYYYAYHGWDPVTGLGTPRVSFLVNLSAKLLEPQGSAIQVVGPGFNYSTISSEVSITANPNQFSGSDFYYLAFYGNSSEFIKFGIMNTNNTLSFGFMAQWNNLSYSSFAPLGSLAGTQSYALSFSRNGSVFTGSVGTKQITANIYMTGIGRFNDSIGAELIGAPGNGSAIPKASFSPLQLDSGSLSAAPEYLLASKYSGLGPAFTTVWFRYNNGYLNTTFSQGVGNSYLTPPPTTSPVAVTYTGDFRPAPTYSFTLQGYTGSVTWSTVQSGTSISANGQITFSSPGRYEIVASTSSLGNFYRNITVPVIYTIKTTISAPFDNLSVDASSLVDSFYASTMSFVGSDVLDYYFLEGSNTFEVSAPGYHPLHESFTVTSSGAMDFALIPLNATLSAYIYPAVHAFTIDGNAVDYGPSTILTASPGLKYINFTSQGEAVSSALFLRPGATMSFQYQASSSPPDNFTFSGYVSDDPYGLPLEGVNVSSNGSYAYTNASGYFSLIVPNGAHSILFSLNDFYSVYYNGTFSSNLSRNMTMKFSSEASQYYIHINRVFSLLFWIYYVSWDYNMAHVAYFKLSYSQSSSMADPTTVTVGYNQAYRLLTISPNLGIYYFTVSAFLQTGNIYTSQVVAMDNSSPLTLYTTLAIYGAIILYVGYFAYMVSRRRRRRREY